MKNSWDVQVRVHASIAIDLPWIARKRKVSKANFQAGQIRGEKQARLSLVQSKLITGGGWYAEAALTQFLPLPSPIMSPSIACP